MTDGDRLTVRGGDELKDVFRRGVDPGDELVLADGTYEDVEVHVAVEGTVGEPITIRSQSGGAVFTGSSHLRVTGDHVVLRDLRFEDSEAVPKYGPVSLWGAEHCRVTDCAFEDLYGMVGTVTLQHGASHNRIDHNHFANCRYRAVRLGLHEEALDVGPPVRNRIDHNVIRDIPDASEEPEAGSAEAIQLGQWGRPWSAYETHTLVENNLFLRCNGENEIISVKTACNTIRDNAFVDCVTGELVLRSAERTTVEGNWFENTDHGIRVMGSGHRIANNVVVEPTGMGIRVPHGTADVDYPIANMRVRSTVVANNTVVNPGGTGIRVGGCPAKAERQYHERFTRPPFDHPTAESVRDVAPYDSVFVNNVVVGREGRLFDVVDAPDNVYSTNLLHATGDAEVGDEGNNAILEAPSFRGPENGDYRLSADSESAHGAGYPIPPVAGEDTGQVGATGCRPPVGPEDVPFDELLELPVIHDIEGLPSHP